MVVVVVVVLFLGRDMPSSLLCFGNELLDWQCCLVCSNNNCATKNGNL